MRALPSLLVLLTLGLALLPAAPAAQPQVRLVVEISDAVSKPTQSFEAFDTIQLNAFDFDGDGDLEIVAKNDNNWIYVLDSRTGAILAQMRESVWADWKWRELGGVAIGDVNGNGRWDLVTGSTAGFVTVWEMDPSESTSSSLRFDKLWSKHVKPTLADPGFYEKNPWARNQSTAFDGAPFLADVDGDGADEVFIQSDNVVGQWAFRGDGELLWGKTYGDGNAHPWVGDLDGDGALEAVFATDAGRVWAYDAKTGKYRWAFNAQEHGVRPGSISVAPGIVDLTGDGRYEVVFGTRVAVEDPNDPEWHLEMHTVVFALTPKGELLWKRQYDWGEPHMYMLPAAADVDGDGLDDAILMDWNTIGHKPGEWQTTGSPNLFAINGRGDLLFHTKVSTYWSNKNVVVADVDGDGAQEILAVQANGLGVYSLQGERKGNISLPWGASRAPLVADLHGDGRMHLVVPVGTKRDEPNYRELDVGYRHGKILVYDLGVPFDAAWDNNLLFNHGLDHLYGGEAAARERRVVDVDVAPVAADDFAVRVEADEDVEAVSARPAGASDWTDLVRRADGAWHGDLTTRRVDVLVRLESGVMATRTVDNLRAGGADPEPGPSEPTDPTLDPPTPDEATPEDGAPRGEDEAGDPPTAKRAQTPGPGLLAAVAVLAGAAWLARRRRA